MAISNLSKVYPKARIGERVTIGDFTIVHDNVVIGDDSVIESHCILGHPTPLADGLPLVIENGAHIRSHSIFYEGSKFGEGLRTGHRVTVREKLTAGKNLQIGTLSDFQGHGEIGDYVRTHSSVHLGQKAKVGNCVWLYPYTVFTNDPHPPSYGHLVGVIVEDYAVVATMASVMPGVRIGTRSLVGAHSLVTKDVEPDTVVAGVPAKRLCRTRDIKLRDGSGESAYPWMRHCHRGYPPELVAKWKAEFGEIRKG
jgi:acetyltransferase-like isoleucine patch superfamily enzyme